MKSASSPLRPDSAPSSKPMRLVPFLRQFNLVKVTILLLLLLLLGLGSAPGYLTGQWRWSRPPKVTGLTQLRQLRQTGLPLSDWQTTGQQTVRIGQQEWSRQTVQNPSGQQAILLLSPQRDGKAQPEVEWMDLNGTERWSTDSERSIQFTVAANASRGQRQATVTGRYLRAWTRSQTYAVLQWYAWPTGGHPAPSHWFWLDRLAQWQNRRVPWVAVSILVPIEPLGDIEAARPLAESLGQSTQGALMDQALRQ